MYPIRNEGPPELERLIDRCPRLDVTPNLAKVLAALQSAATVYFFIYPYKFRYGLLPNLFWWEYDAHTTHLTPNPKPSTSVRLNIQKVEVHGRCNTS